MNRFFDIYDFPLFANCNKDVIDNFINYAVSRITSYNEKDIVVLQDTPCRSLMLLCKGSLSARMTNSDGKEIAIETLKAPNILAPAFLYGSVNLFPVTLIAEEKSAIWSLSKDAFLKLMEVDSSVLNSFLKDISDRSVFLSRKLNEFALQSLSERIISYLHYNKKITNVQELAFIMGVARPSLSRTLSAMVENNIVIKTSSGYILNDNIYE